ncbi:SGNH/GDSL hydrolase family protein [Bradyrhizobium sp. HKCCYLS3077]|uniref:SGNH/GDSL hydrolase family protein n=1 Tax=Bradyrhizobium sp. HKCCYLS3077 TaxID=3420761 RepID=UPI003EBD3DC4
MASVLFALIVSPQLSARRADPDHYYRASADPLLGYELRPGMQIRRDGRELSINSHGLRGPEPVTPKPTVRFAILGDSVTFGIQQSEAQTISRLMETKLSAACGTSVDVLNMGVPGYGAQEVGELLRTRAKPLSIDGVVYLLNLNDFARRNSLWEGADSGLYRMYAPPLLKLPFFLQKALYRWKKGGKDDGMMPSLDWYRWLIDGTFDTTIAEIAAMNAWARAAGIGFSVSIMPSGVALGGGQNALADEHRKIGEALSSRGVAVVDDVRPFMGEAKLFDGTDHLTNLGNEIAAAHLVGVLASTQPSLLSQAACGGGSPRAERPASHRADNHADGR